MKNYLEIMNDEYRIINLENGDYIQIKYDVEGIIYDRFDKNDEHIESLGYDFYVDIRNLSDMTLYNN
jgi:hypothetical protein